MELNNRENDREVDGAELNELSIADIRSRLANSHGSKHFWRSLEEVAETPAFQKLLEAEFPRQIAASLADMGRSGAARTGASRREFLKLMGAALTMAGLTGCTTSEPEELIIPYVTAPEEIVPGKPLFYATAIHIDGYAIGVLAESHMGRPTKLEGNPQHPASLGGTNPLVQGALLNLYDPDRAKVLTRQGQISTWDSFLAEINSRLEAFEGTDGAGFHLLTGTVTSPTLGTQIAALLERFPAAQWHQYEPVGRGNAQAGALLAFGQPVQPVYHFDRAQRIFSLDNNFLYEEAGSIHYALDFIDQRRVWVQPEMNRLYMLESTPTITGAKADHKLAVPASRIEDFARALALALQVPLTVEAGLPLSEEELRWIQIAARDLAQYGQHSLVLAGETQPPAVHALAHAINQALGSIGTTVTYIPAVVIEPSLQLESLYTLTAAMAAGEVDTLVIVDCNPALTAPVDFAFDELLVQVPFTVHMSLYYDETSALCQWHIPNLHELESWSDARAYDGTATILQPLIAPLFGGISTHELLSILVGNEAQTTAYELVRAHWEQYYTALATPPIGDFELFWRTSIHHGIVPETTFAPVPVELQLTTFPAPTVARGGLELNFRPDTTIWDGQFANNVFLQELPAQLTLLTWDNALLISPATAELLGVSSQQIVEVYFRDRMLAVAALITPGQPNDAMTLHLGYGREWAGKVSEQVGFNAYSLRTSDAFWFGTGVEIVPTGIVYPLATVQDHDSIEGRDLLRAGTLAQYLEDPFFAVVSHESAVNVTDGSTSTGVEELEPPPPSFYPEYEYPEHAWAMEIDLTACIGCNACTIACQVENSIPVVGKEGILNNREMYWIRVDRYYEGELDDPSAHFQPRPCMHCEKAPCEPVCPVAATVHDSEGLNQMIYNRCVGTRYCSNNCPYKVRRFNFFDYAGEEIPLMQMWRNPDVTVRSRGVMEKCTYCVQRINQGRIEAEKENRLIGEAEVLTACQQACPTRAITFGDMSNPDSIVSVQKQHPLNYGMLAELGTQPRTTYLAEIRNPNPELEA